jgi:hypothetical protein
MAAPLEFDGPPNFHVFGNIYTTMTHAGPLDEDHQMILGYPTEESAMRAFHGYMEEFSKGADQIAWRLRPEATKGPDGFWTVRARVAVFRHENDGKSA